MYPTSLSDSGWEVLSVIFESYGIVDKGRTHRLKTVVDAIFYVVGNGVKWRNLPNDFLAWKTVYGHFRNWFHSGLWARASLAVTEAARWFEGRDESSSLCSVDSQSQTAEPGVHDRRLDGGK